VVLLDADEAGARAAERALPMFSAAGVEAWRLQLPDAKDPDELIQAGGPEAMESALQLRVPLLEWVARRKLGQYGHSAAGKERTLEELLQVLTEPSPAQLSELAAILRLQEKFVLDRARTISARPPEVAPPADMPPDPMYEPPAPQWRPHRDVVHLLWLMVHRYEEVADLMMRVDPRVLDAHAAVRPALARLTLREPVTNIIDDETDRGVKKTLVAVVARERLYTRDEAALALCDILARLTKPLHEAEMAFQTDQFLHANRRGEPEAARLALAARMRIKQLELGIQQALQAGEIEELILLLEPAEPVDEPEEQD
jgi:DNA primase